MKKIKKSQKISEKGIDISEKKCIIYVLPTRQLICESGGTGRRARLRGVWLHRTGSSPVSRTKKSYHFDTTFFIHYGVMAYHQKRAIFSLFFAYHHALAFIKLRNDDIQCFALMIFSHFVSNDIHFLRKWLKLQSFFVFCRKI